MSAPTKVPPNGREDYESGILYPWHIAAMVGGPSGWELNPVGVAKDRRRGIDAMLDALRAHGPGAVGIVHCSVLDPLFSPSYEHLETVCVATIDSETDTVVFEG